MIVPLALGLVMFILSLCVESVPIAILLRIATSKQSRSWMRPSYPANLVLIQLVSVLLLFAQLVNVALWAVLFRLCGEFADFPTAYYHSAVNYSSLGYGDIVLSMRWRLLGPLEAIDGLVMFGVSTALIFALLERLIERRLKAQEQNTSTLHEP